MMLPPFSRTGAAILPGQAEALGQCTRNEEDRNEQYTSNALCADSQRAQHGTGKAGHLMLKRGIALAVAAFASGFPCASSYADSCTDLTGTYVCQKYCPAEGIGGYDKVVQDGDELQLSNGKTSVKGYLSGAGARAIIATWIWKENPLKGTLNADCSEIDWVNGSVWVRKN